MDALILAAGLGTRLKPWTDHVPKALIEVGGRTLLEHVAARLAAAGATRLVVTVCHLAEQIERFVAARDLGAQVALSPEPGGPYDTGGGLLHAAPRLRRHGPILVHNVDVLSDVPLERVVKEHASSGALATLVVMRRPSSRRLLFDDVGLLGRVDDGKALRALARPATGPVVELAFAGVHTIAPSLLERITERGTFSVLDTWLRLASEGARILPFRADGSRWLDVGRPADLERARAEA
jgi:NDP-sugar pyrophosphorylase family protein